MNLRSFNFISDIFTVSILLLLFMYHIVLFFGQRKQVSHKSTIYFAFFVFTVAGYIITRTICNYTNTKELIISIEAVFASAAFFCIDRFFNLMINLPKRTVFNKISEYLLLICLVLAQTSLIISNEWYLKNMFMYVVIIYFISMMIISLSFVYHIFRQKIIGVNYVKTIFIAYFLLILYLIIVKFFLSIDNNLLIARNHLFVGIIAFLFSYALAQKATIDLKRLLDENKRNFDNQSKQGLLNLIEEKISSFSLTPRETEVLFYVAKGLEYKEIADKLNISTRTVIRHIQNIFEKTDVHNKVELLNKLS